jgi:PHD/YefM family antitoxin component YafN of YafNO toxin-antitoxin module
MRKPKVTHMPMTKARVNLGAVVRALHREPDTVIVLEKSGLPVAALMSLDELEDLLDLRDPELRRQIREGWEDFQAGRGRPLDDVLAELARESG